MIEEFEEMEDEIEFLDLPMELFIPIIEEIEDEADEETEEGVIGDAQ